MKGSLNTMNYLKPIGFFNKIKAFFSPHHGADIKTQYEIYSIRAFDFHIDFNSNGKAYFRYNGIPYKTYSIYHLLNYLNKRGDACVRMVLDCEDKSVDKETRFYDYCSTIEKIYGKIHFFGGYRENDFRTIYKFKSLHLDRKIDWYYKLV